MSTPSSSSTPSSTPPQRSITVAEPRLASWQVTSARTTPSGAEQVERATQHRGGVPPAAVGRKHAEPDVPADPGQVGVELVPDRQATHQHAVDVGDQERGGDAVRCEPHPAKDVLEPRDVLGPRLVVTPVEQEGEALVGQHLVGLLRRSADQAQRPRD